MTDGEGAPPPARLRHAFERAVENRGFGGASVLEELSQISFECIAGASETKDAVAFALGAFLHGHAADKDERPVTSEEAYAFAAAAHDHVSDAVNFIDQGGSAEEAIRVIAALGRTSPARLYRPNV